MTVQGLESQQGTVHQRTGQTGDHAQRNQPYVAADRQLRDIAEIQDRAQSEAVFRYEIGGQRCGRRAHKNRRRKAPMHAFQREHHAGQRRAERRRKARGRTCGHQIMLLHVLTASATQPMGQELRAARADLDGRAFAAKRQAEQRAKQSADETHRQNRLPPHPQAAHHHAVGLRNAAAARHGLLANHPGDCQRDGNSCESPRDDERRMPMNPRVHPTGELRATFDAQPVHDHQNAGNQADEHAGSRHFPFQMVKMRNQLARGRGQGQCFFLSDKLLCFP